jgi:2-amino-4-hydroxy-6-hydroxymethyldihydropteridine diphosphokinase
VTAYTRAVLALGSNLGARRDTLSAAVAGIVDSAAVRLRDVSPVVRTKAVGGPENQPDFLNMVMEVDTTLDPYQLLALCQSVEKTHLRTREVRWGPRTLDVDIITYGDRRSADPVLTLPHPRAAQRAFVLYPWAVMDPTAELDGVPVAELAAAAADMDTLQPFVEEGPGDDGGASFAGDEQAQAH